MNGAPEQENARHDSLLLAPRVGLLLAVEGHLVAELQATVSHTLTG